MVRGDWLPGPLDPHWSHPVIICILCGRQGSGSLLFSTGFSSGTSSSVEMGPCASASKSLLYSCHEAEKTALEILTATFQHFLFLRQHVMRVCRRQRVTTARQSSAPQTPASSSSVSCRSLVFCRHERLASQRRSEAPSGFEMK